MQWVAATNSQGVERILAEPVGSWQRHVREAGPEEAKVLLRYQSSELNRHFMHYWELFQIGYGICFAITLLFATNGHRLMVTLAVAMIATVVTEHVTVSPRIVEIWRGLDFATTDQMIPERQVFRSYLNFYSGLEIAKLTLGAGLAARLIISCGSGTAVRR